jgi:hypothetical protein
MTTLDNICLSSADNFKEFAEEFYSNNPFGPWVTCVLLNGEEVEADQLAANYIRMNQEIECIIIGCIHEGSGASYPSSVVRTEKDLENVLLDIADWSNEMEESE